MKHGHAAFRKFRIAAARAAPRTNGLPGGFFMTDPDRTENPAAIIEALPAHIGVIIRHFGQTREKQQARTIVEQCHAASRPVLIAADPVLALETSADGVHWPFRLRAEAARHAHKFALSTLSVHCARELRLARTIPVDAIIFSTVFASDSPTASRPTGAMRLAATVKVTHRPVYALGGITAQNAGRITRYAGFASVSGFQDLVACQDGV